MASKYSKKTLIYKKYQHMVCALDIESSGIGVYLKRPYIFSVSEASCTFMPFELFEDKKDPFKSCVWAINQCIREEAEIDPSQVRKTPKGEAE